MSSTETLLEVDNLGVTFSTEDGEVQAVRGISYTVRRNQVLGIVGESGSGKSVSSMALMGLLPSSAKITGSATYLDQSLIGVPDRHVRKLRGDRIAMIFQDPMTSLNPVYSIGKQLGEIVRAHYRVSPKEARSRAIDALEMVGIPEPGQRVDNYPHEFSGGMRQRVMIAMAMMNKPDVIIADEPTTALDVTVQAQVLETLLSVKEELQAAIVLITHDLGVIASTADDVAVMYAGRIVERGDVDHIFDRPQMPYTRGLLGAIPSADRAVEELTPIRGTPPSMLNPAPGCPFRPRCDFSADECAVDEPFLTERQGAAQLAACHRVDLPEWQPASIGQPSAEAVVVDGATP